MLNKETYKTNREAMELPIYDNMNDSSLNIPSNVKLLITKRWVQVTPSVTL